MKNKNEESIICIYEEGGPTISDKILEAFEKYLKSIIQNAKLL